MGVLEAGLAGKSWRRAVIFPPYLSDISGLILFLWVRIYDFCCTVIAYRKTSKDFYWVLCCCAGEMTWVWCGHLILGVSYSTLYFVTCGWKAFKNCIVWANEDF